MDHYGNAIDKFELVDAFPISVDFGSLDYSSTDLVTVTITWEYRTIKAFAGVSQTPEAGPSPEIKDATVVPMEKEPDPLKDATEDEVIEYIESGVF